MNYWIDKDERAKLAIEHTSIVAQKYKTDIINCINNTIIYGGPDKKPEKPEITRGVPSLIFDNCLSQEAVFKYTKDDDRVAILNFASYKGPGGGFIKGSRAQEEMLCHYSFLYNVIKEQENYYQWNNEHKNRALYLDRALYTPKIKFFDDLQNTEVDVITCAAPNYGVAHRYQKVTREENYKILRSRIQFIIDIAEENNISTLILGAFGCGVFKQPPEDVAEIFTKVLQNTSINRIIMAVPGNDNNAKVFKKYSEAFPFLP